MKIKRIKWKNVIALVIFMICFIFLLAEMVMLCTSTATVTYFGTIINIALITISSFIGDYLYDEMQ